MIASGVSVATHLSYKKYNGAAESSDKRRREHDFYTVGEDSYYPRNGERKRGDEDDPPPAELHGHAAEQSAEERSKERETCDPGRLLR